MGHPDAVQKYPVSRPTKHRALIIQAERALFHSILGMFITARGPVVGRIKCSCRGNLHSVKTLYSSSKGQVRGLKLRHAAKKDGQRLPVRWVGCSQV